MPSGACEPGQLRQQRGLHRLEQQDQDARDEEARDEAADRGLLFRRVRHERHAEEAGVRQQLRQQRTEEQHAERARQLVVGRRGPRYDEVVLPAQRDEDRDERRQGERQAIPTRRSDARHEQHGAERDPNGAFRPVHEAVRAESAVARERSSGHVRQVVTRLAADLAVRVVFQQGAQQLVRRRRADVFLTRVLHVVPD